MTGRYRADRKGGSGLGEVRSSPGRPLTDTPSTVLYITGFGRSGSTLLERILGTLPGFVNVGELVSLFPRVVVQDQVCGCGARFSACAFWRGVGRRAFDDWDPERVNDLAALQRRVPRQRNLARILAPRLGDADFRADLDRYRTVYRALYRAILAESGAHVVIDASKWPVHALALDRDPGIDLRVLHLVRDSRGVAYSWAKSGIVLPHLPDQGRTLRSHPVSEAALRWSAAQAEAAILTRRSVRSAKVRYEDWMANPGPSVRAALTDLGFGEKNTQLTGFADNGVRLGPSHGIAGNPARFAEGFVPMRLDDAWRSKLPPRSRRVVTALTFPQLLAYGYVSPTRRTTKRSPEV